MSADFTPTQQTIKDMRPFRFWCQKVLPTVYDDSLSYYELLTKVVNYLNDTVDNVNTLNENVENIYNAYVLLQNYLNEFVDTQVIPMVEAKLDEMAEDGTLTALIKAYIDPYFDEKSDEIEEAFDAQNNAIAEQNEIMTDAISRQNTTINSAIGEQSNAITVMRAELSTFLSNYSGTSDVSAEVADIRVGADGTVYQTAGDAVREQVGDLQDNLAKHSDILSTNLMGVDVQQNLYPGAADWSGEWSISDRPNIGVSSVLFEGYSTVYSSQPWRRYYKTIPVSAGKTYTFECWINHASQGATFLYLQNTSEEPITNPATLSKTFAQFNGTPANVWVKLSVTFTCTASGDITPWAYSGAGAFYIAKYTLVEGEKVFSLSDSLASKATQEQISGIGDYQAYTYTIGASLGRWMNHTFSKNVSQGDKVRLVFDSYSGSAVLERLNLYGKKQDTTFELFAYIENPKHGDFTEAYAINDYTELRIQYVRVTDESNVTGVSLIATNHALGIANDILAMRETRVFHIEPNGSGDFTTFIDGINEACKYMDSVVYVGAGEYDLLAELGSDYLSNPSSDKKGIVLKNRVHVIGTAQTVLKMNNTGPVLEYISPINTGEHGCTLENITIIDNGVRYSIHDDRGWSGSVPYSNKFINCTLIHKNGMYGDCIGGGLGENCDIEITGCYLEGDSNVERLAYYHGNNHTGVTNAKGHITVNNNYFAGNGSFWVQKYGDSTEMTTALVSNNSMGSAPQVTTGTNAQNNMRIIAWNNEIRV